MGGLSIFLVIAFCLCQGPREVLHFLERRAAPKQDLARILPHVMEMRESLFDSCCVNSKGIHLRRAASAQAPLLRYHQYCIIVSGDRILCWMRRCVAVVCETK